MKFDFQKAKWIIPVLALLVIMESVLIVQRVSDKKKGITPESVTGEVEQEKVIMISFSGDQEIEMGKEGQVTVKAAPLKNLNLDGADILIEYDPAYLEVLGTSPTDKFTYTARNWIEPEKKRVLVTMLETELPEGLALTAGEEINLLTISLKSVKSGETTLKVINGEDSGTGFTENGTAKRLPFSAEDFEIVIGK